VSNNEVSNSKISDDFQRTKTAVYPERWNSLRVKFLSRVCLNTAVTIARTFCDEDECNCDFRGQLNLVSIIEELVERKRGCGLEIRE
jgi:hypothetical protein